MIHNVGNIQYQQDEENTYAVGQRGKNRHTGNTLCYADGKRLGTACAIARSNGAEQHT